MTGGRNRLDLCHRIRPLPALLIQDACEATHYLPYICNSIKRKLIENSPPSLNLVESVRFCHV